MKNVLTTILTAGAFLFFQNAAFAQSKQPQAESQDAKTQKEVKSQDQSLEKKDIELMKNPKLVKVKKIKMERTLIENKTGANTKPSSANEEEKEHPNVKQDLKEQKPTKNIPK